MDIYIFNRERVVSRRYKTFYKMILRITKDTIKIIKILEQITEKISLILLKF